MTYPKRDKDGATCAQIIACFNTKHFEWLYIPSLVIDLPFSIHNAIDPMKLHRSVMPTLNSLV
jgi:hypothetical protein